MRICHLRPSGTKKTDTVNALRSNKIKWMVEKAHNKKYSIFVGVAVVMQFLIYSMLSYLLLFSNSQEINAPILLNPIQIILIMGLRIVLKFLDLLFCSCQVPFMCIFRSRHSSSFWVFFRHFWIKQSGAEVSIRDWIVWCIMIMTRFLANTINPPRALEFLLRKETT